MDLGAALIALLTGLVVKGLVLVWGATLLLRFYRAEHERTPKPWLLLPRLPSGERPPEIRLLWWSLVLFYASELTCGIEVYVILRSNPYTSGIHAICSGLGMSLFALGLYELLDRKLLRFAEPACLLNRICPRCTVLAEAGCRFRTVLLLAGTLIALAALLPLFVSTARMNADVSAWILPFDTLNSWYDAILVPWLEAHFDSYQRSGLAYWLPESMLFIELRLLPLLALALTLVGLRQLQAGHEQGGARFLVGATGVLAYVYLEIVLYRATGDVILGSLGHEVAEFWFLAATAALLRRVFPPEARLAQ